MSELEEQEEFSTDDAIKASLVTLMQIKDYLAVMAYSMAPVQTEAVEKMHEDGKTVGSFPFYNPYGENDEQS